LAASSDRINTPSPGITSTCKWALKVGVFIIVFWDGRYRSTSFPDHEQQRALNTLRYIHANPKTAGMRKGYFYAYSNYGICDRPADGLSEWQPFYPWGKVWTPAKGVTIDSANATHRRKKLGGFALVDHHRQCLMPGAMKKSVAAGAGSGYDFALGAQEGHGGAPRRKRRTSTRF
jgi:hypothetical protein